DGHPGYGNLDVFASRIFDTTVSEPINLEDPVNTIADDFAFIVDDINHNGYFSSNRKGGKGDDDIYHFVAFPPLHIDGHQAIAGVITDKISGIMIPGATVSLLDEDGKELETINLPEAVSEFVPYTNDPDQPQISELKIEKGEIEDIRIQKTVDNESPNPNDIVEFTVEISNLGTTNASGIKVSDILPKGYVYVADDGQGEYSKSDDNISITELMAGNNKVLKIKARIVPVEVNSAFSFNAISNTNYKIKVSAPGYLPFVTDVKTANDTDIPPLEIDLILDQELRVDNEKIMVNINTIYFDFDKWNIRPDAARELDKVIAVMKEHPSMVIQSGSHTDSRGSDRYNQRLSQRRAEATVDYIVAGGIDRKRITARGYGESQLVNACANGVKCSKEEQQLNRRTEFVIVNDNERITSTDATIDNVIVGEGKLTKGRDINAQNRDERIEYGGGLPYKIVVGSFKKSRNADRRVNQLQNKGYSNASIISDKKSSLVKVSVSGYKDKQDALRNLEIIRRELDKDAWLLKLDQPSANTEAVPAVDKEEVKAEKAPDEKPIQVNSENQELIEVEADEAKPEVKVEANQDDRFSGSVARKTADHYIELPPVYYKYDSWSLSDDEFIQLDKIIEILRDNPTLVIEAGVHTDTKNLESYNLLLSQKRARTIVDYIVSKGISPDRIYGKGYGEEGIVNICKNLVKCSQEAHQENRRTEFMIIEGNGYPETELIEKNGDTFINTNPIYFDKDSDKIRKDAAYELDRVAVILRKNPNMNIEVGSHTDSQNVKSYNLKLSLEMAESVKEYLISKGVDAQRIRAVGYGESGLLNKCTSFVKCTPGEHQKNRRTEIKVIEK
ncbi:MAG: OmpA family protein, partial [Flavobacteriaceae bacterium]|nr:OmpA family protein [Flavobacteriaceae bacterium]